MTEQMIGRTRQEGMERALRALCETFGPRPVGSQANREAAAWCAKEFGALGYAVEEQRFSCMDWQDGGARLAVDGAAVAADAVKASGYSNPCDVTGRLVAAGTVEELRGADAEGDILVLHGALCAEPLMPKSMTFWNPPEHQEIIRLLEEKRPGAIITVSYVPGYPAPVIEDGDFDIPCAVVRGDLGAALLAGRTARLTIAAQRRPSEGANVIARNGKSGDSGGNDGNGGNGGNGGGSTPLVSFSAHIDTAAGAPGALDDGAGVAVLLELARRIREERIDAPVEFVLFNGEDYYSTPGEMAFMGSSLQDPAQKRGIAFNVDGVGLRGSPTSFSLYECADETLAAAVRATFSVDGAFEEIEPWPMGDHMLFASCGVPAVALTASNIFALTGSMLHTPADTPDQVDPGVLCAVVDRLLAYLKR